MSQLGLGALVGPSVFEAPALAAMWCTEAENFEWAYAHSPLVMLDWVPPECRTRVLERCRLSPTFAVIGSCSFASLNGGTQETRHWTEVTHSLFGRQLPTSIFLAQISLWNLLPLARPDLEDARSYFDNTPTGPYCDRSGQHLWTDGSMKMFKEIQVVGAGIAGFLPGFTPFNFNVGCPVTYADLSTGCQRLDPTSSHYQGTASLFKSTP
eukprot:74724-Rhodomonas_salina.2